MSDLKDYHFYIIYCKNDANLSYIGKTYDINVREKEHMNNSIYNQYHYKIYQSIRENGGWDNWIMEEISYQKGLTILESRVIEQILINDLGNLNEIKAYISKEDKLKNKKQSAKEYYLANKEQVDKYQKEYREAHKEQIQEKKKEYYQVNIEQIKTKKKEYYETHKEQIAERDKKYCEKNAEKIKEKNAEKVTCECGCIVARYKLQRHRRRIKHLELFIKL